MCILCAQNLFMLLLLSFFCVRFGSVLFYSVKSIKGFILWPFAYCSFTWMMIYKQTSVGAQNSKEDDEEYKNVEINFQFSFLKIYSHYVVYQTNIIFDVPFSLSLSLSLSLCVRECVYCFTILLNVTTYIHSHIISWHITSSRANIRQYKCDIGTVII